MSLFFSRPPIHHGSPVNASLSRAGKNKRNDFFGATDRHTKRIIPSPAYFKEKYGHEVLEVMLDHAIPVIIFFKKVFANDECF